MSSSTKTRPTQAAAEALAALGAIPAISAPLQTDSGTIADELLNLVLDEIDAYADTANPEIVPELKDHLEELVAEILHIMAGAPPGQLEFVRRYARRKAQQRFPLEATLHTYRCCHRVLSGRIRDAALAVADPNVQVRRVVAAAADLVIEYTDAISTLATSEYVQQTRALAEAESDRRSELLNMLLSGYDEANSRAAELLRRSGYLEQRQSFCVLVARSVDAREMANAPRAQRMVDAIRQTLHDMPLRSLIGVRDGLVTAVVSGARRLSGWTAPQSLLADRIYPRLNQVGPAAIIGLSADAPSTTHVRRAHTEAQLALDFASVSNRVMAYSSIPFRRMLIHHARDNISMALPVWHAEFRLADKKARGSLARTLRAYADANMNALQTGKDLAVHPNTVYSRMQRIHELTGRNPLDYHDLTELLLAIESAASPTTH